MHADSTRLLLTMSVPSGLLQYLQETRKLDPELEILQYIPQQTDHHPEGDVFTHTCMVVDYAARLSTFLGLDEFNNAVLRLAALTHDFGKPATTIVYADGRVTAHDHPAQGVPIAEVFLTRSNIHPDIIACVLPLVREHMAHVGFYTPDITTRAVKRLIQRLNPTTIDMLAWLVEADASGRGGQYYNRGMPARMAEIRNVAYSLDTVYRPEPLIDGNIIMQLLNIEPSKRLGEIKAAMYSAQLRGELTTIDDAVHFVLREYTHDL